MNAAVKDKLRIKKIPPELRVKRNTYRQEPVWFKRLILRYKEDSQFYRSTVQVCFFLLCIWIGIEFHLFLRWGMLSGKSIFVNRPPGVEGFLPISALISLKYWLSTGIVNNIHPAGFFIFLAIVTISVLLKKAFCSWLCPIGTISESLWMLGRRLMNNNLTLPKWLDYPLRSLKYIILLFFLYTILQMDTSALENFIASPYNKIADIKLYLFFSQISTFALWTIITFILLSIFVKNFWCRYLCPYGALLGALSWLSPFNITRNLSTCVDCELCTKVCPANIRVHISQTVRSDECSACLACVAACPVKRTLEIKTPFMKNQLPSWIFGTLIVGIFIAITGIAILTNHWHTTITSEEYLQRIQTIDSPIYEHF
ncbi:MAG: 4Fe-4S binding protein [Bacteroidota bacterium]